LLKRYLQSDDAFREGHVNAVQNNIETGYCRQVPTDDVSTNATCYLPHRAVINPRKPVSSEISDLLILLFVSYFAFQSKGIKFDDYFWMCVV